jgi:hypothetical protein
VIPHEVEFAMNRNVFRVLALVVAVVMAIIAQAQA